jgi:2-oxoglutarate ferredoxin oxidoreductase subunit beta
VLRAAATHHGTALVEIYQNCNIFNDGAFDTLKDRTTAQDALIRLEHGKPIRFGPPGPDGLGTKGITRDPTTADLRVTDTTTHGTDGLLVHDAHADSPTTAFALTRLADPHTLHHTPIGILRDIERPVYDDAMNTQLDQATTTQGPGNLTELLTGNDTWTVTG